MTNAEIIQAIRNEIERQLNDKKEIGDLGGIWALQDVLSFISDLEKSEKPMNPEAAMKELDEKIALVRQRGTWDGVDVDKYMDEVRGREPEKPMQEGLEVEYKDYVESDPVYSKLVNRIAGLSIARHFAKWGADHTPLPEDTVLFNKGVAEGKRLMMEEAVDAEVWGEGYTSRRIISDWLGPEIGKPGDKVRIIILPKEDEHD